MRRTDQFLTLLTSKCASRHNGVHFFDISTSKSGPGMVCFDCFVHFDLEMCCAPQRRAIVHLSSGQLAPHAALASLLFDRPKSLEKHSVSRLCYFFAHLHLLSSHSFSALIFSLLLFSCLTLLTSAFSSVHIFGGLTSKLPSISYNNFSDILAVRPMDFSNHSSDVRNLSFQLCGGCEKAFRIRHFQDQLALDGFEHCCGRAFLWLGGIARSAGRLKDLTANLTAGAATEGG